MGQEFPVVIGAAPRSEIDLRPEIEMIKSALVYGDRVRLFSPLATILGWFGSIESLPEEQREPFLLDLAAVLHRGGGHWRSPEYVCRTQEDAATLKRATLAPDEMEQQLKSSWDDLVGVARKVLEDSGAVLLTPAIESGLLEVDALLGEVTDDPWQQLLDSFLAKLLEALHSKGEYPLFDQRRAPLFKPGPRKASS